MMLVNFKSYAERSTDAVEVLTSQRNEKFESTADRWRGKNALEALDYLRLFNDHVRAKNAETEKNKHDVTNLEMLGKHPEECEEAHKLKNPTITNSHEKQAVGFEERPKHANAKAKKLRKTVR
ncbi:hypothetical protein EV363DRAFT_1091668, partial [Boletus edulis]